VYSTRREETDHGLGGIQTLHIRWRSSLRKQVLRARAAKRGERLRFRWKNFGPNIAKSAKEKKKKETKSKKKAFPLGEKK